MGGSNGAKGMVVFIIASLQAGMTVGMRENSLVSKRLVLVALATFKNDNSILIHKRFLHF